MLVSKKAAKKELEKRIREPERREIILDPSFTAQNAFVNDPNRFIAACCSRRAGKTNALALKFFKAMEAHPGSQCVYMSLTRDSALNILWPILKEFDERFNIGAEFIESKLVMRHPNGAILRLLGADQKGFIKRLKGIKTPAAAIDEAQDFGTHLQSLIDDVITPMLADYPDGWLALTGTPGPVPQGYFFDVTYNKRFGYSVHGWTLLDNPYMPAPGAFIEELKKKREWDDRNPTLLREWQNQWVLDVQSLWVKYSEKVNHYQSLPHGKWNYGLGIDIGFKDADALAVVAWTDTSPDTYLIEEIVESKQDLTALVEKIRAMQAKYDIAKMVIDEGGLGKKLAEELRRRHGIPVHPADKARKQENVEILNDALRLGRFKAKSASRFAQDSYLVQIDWEKSSPNKVVIKKKPHSDIIDAVLYIFKESPAYSYEAPGKEAPKFGTKEWAEQQTSAMWQDTLESMQKEQEYLRWQRGED